MLSNQRNQISLIAIVFTVYFVAAFSASQSKAFSSANISPTPQISPTIYPSPSPTPKTITIGACTRFQVKLSTTITSHIARAGDYVEFKVLDDVNSRAGETLIKKDTKALGYVSSAHRRHFPLLPGKVWVKLDKVKAVGGKFVKIFIVRHYGCDKEPCESYIPKCYKPMDVEKYDVAQDYNSLERSTKNKYQIPKDYIAGRTHPAFEPLLSPGITAGASIVGASTKSSTPLAILFVLFAVEGVDQLLAGTDSELDADEIFDVYVTDNATVTVKNVDGSKTSSNEQKPPQ